MSTQEFTNFGYDRQKALNYRDTTRQLEKANSPKNLMKERVKSWFDYWMRYGRGRCENCNEPIEIFPDLKLRAAQAHILPKAIFTDVCDDLDNHMTLGPTCGCHSRWDKSWESASRMPVFERAWHRVQKFLHKITEPNQRKKIPEIFLKPLPSKSENGIRGTLSENTNPSHV
jgi:hypothetical protein